jgi:hypothetical protein
MSSAEEFGVCLAVMLMLVAVVRNGLSLRKEQQDED